MVLYCGNSNVEKSIKIDNYYGFENGIDGSTLYNAENNEDLVKLIEDFDEEKYNKEREEFYTRLGFCEDGHASERCADWIIDKIK